MSDIIPFTYNTKQVRVIKKNGEPWFVVKDICEILEIGNPSDVIKRLDKDEVDTIEVIDNLRRKQSANAVNESGMYALILTSRKPEAENFKRWIRKEVLPQIRKTGTYTLQPMSQLQILQQAVNALVEQENRIKSLESTTQTIKDTIIQEPDNWREDMNRMFNKIVDHIGGKKFQEVRNESYKLLEQRAHVDLNRRLMNLRMRMLNQGATKTAIDKANKLDVVEQDPKLREIYAQIIKEYYIRYVA